MPPKSQLQTLVTLPGRAPSSDDEKDADIHSYKGIPRAWLSRTRFHSILVTPCGVGAVAITILQGDAINAWIPEEGDGWVVGLILLCSQSAATTWLCLPLDKPHWKADEGDVIRIHTK